MTYFESAENIKITKAHALQELKNHGIIHPEDFQRFLMEMGDCEEYTATGVLIWLGY